MAEANLPASRRTRKSTGGVVAPTGQRRSWSIRFRVEGKRYTQALGRPEEGWNRARAEAALDDVLAEIRLGVWEPPSAPAPVAATAPENFHAFASRWLEEREPELRDRTKVDYRWRLSTHLLPFFAEYDLAAITVEAVDSYRRSKVREAQTLQAARDEQAKLPAKDRKTLPRPLSASSINKTIRLLAAILEQAVEYDLIAKNPAKGRRRLLRESKPSGTFLQPPQVVALLDAAAALDADARDGDSGRRAALLSVLVLAGLRIGEALDLRWRDVNLGAGRLRVTAAKTDAGVRDVVLSPALLETLTEYRARAPFIAPDDYVFATTTGARDGESNVRRRFLAGAVEGASAALAERGEETIGSISPHSLRRTFISLLLYAGIDLPRVMAEAGHTDPKMTLGLYAKVMTLGDEDFGPLLEALVGRGYRAQSGAETADSTVRAAS
jgi:integrase